MKNLNLLEKLQTLIGIVKSSSLFIIASIICVLLITYMINDYKRNKRVNGKAFIISWIFTMTFIVGRFYKEFALLSDNLVEEVVSAIYFPNLAVYIVIFISMNIVCLYTLIKNKFYLHKISSIISTSFIDFLFILIMDTIIKNDIDVYKKLTVYSNKELLVLIELTSGIFTLWILFTGFVKLVNMTINKETVPVSVPENTIPVVEEKKVPDYVIPTPVDVKPLYNVNDNVFAAFEPVKNVTYTISEPTSTGKLLYDKFNRGEDLNVEQYKLLKNYIMTK